MDYNELFKQYHNLLAENDRLRNENDQLRQMLGLQELSNEELSLDHSSVTMHSSAEDKISLFRSLFYGREDIFARRWYSKTTAKSGYQPVCSNEWVEGICDKQKYKCSVCPNRMLTPLSNDDIFRHLSGKDPYGRDVIGIYPMLKDETCNFLCVDFDGADYKSDVSAFCNVCMQHHIPACVERSRSGEGAHVWIFFETSIESVLARKLGSGILTETMEKQSSVSFASYDRLFPNQDTMPKGGFGNLIALPLQGKARKEGNSLFVDKNFIPYKDQWAYLSGVKKMNREFIENVVAKLCKNGDTGILVSDSDTKPWEGKRETKISLFDFPNHLTIIFANMLYVPRKGISTVAQDYIKRLAAFRNPDFYRAQAMRLPIYDKPRIISISEISDEYIGIPRGCKTALCDFLEHIGVSYEIDDKRNLGESLSVSFQGVLREEQQSAANALLNKSDGVLSATTAFGKTVIASYLIGERKTNTLVLVHSKSLMQQWKTSLGQFLTIDAEPPQKPKGKGRRKVWSPIGMLSGSLNNLSGLVDIAVIQSLVSGDEVKELVRNYGMIIVDECHHVSAVTFEKILRFTNAKYVYGLTATPTRQDGHHPIIFMQCGPIRYYVDAKNQAEKRDFEHYLIPRFTSYRTIKQDIGIAAVYKDLAENDLRNQLIVKDVSGALEHGRNPIILTERREHVMKLAEMLSGVCDNIITLFGTSSARERRESLERLDSISERESFVIIATGKYVGEGFDYPRLDTLFLALPIAWKGKVAQYAGRLHRDFPGKSEVQIYDYVDIHIPMLEKMYQKRLKGYAAVGYHVKVSAELPIAPDLIYDGKSFYSVFCKDIQNAKKEVLIVSPFMRKNRIKQMIEMLSGAILNTVSVTVITRPPEDYKENEREAVIQNVQLLQGYGVNVVFRSGFHQKFTLIDQNIVWYGSVNFLSFGSSEESIMRFLSHDISGQLMDTVL